MTDDINKEIDLRDYYPRMNACTKYLRELPKPKRKPSNATIKQYGKDIARMDKNNDDPLSLCTSKNTYYKYRAAWSFSYREISETLISNIKEAQKKGSKNHVVFLIKQLELAVKQLKRFPPDPGGNNIKLQEKGGYRSPWQDVKDKAPKSKSKKYQKLPENWSEKYFNKILEKNSKYINAIALMSMSGCRPAEIEDGVVLELNSNGSVLISINSKKTHDGQYGQTNRSFAVKSDDIEFKYLKNLLENNDDKLFIKIESGKNLGNQMDKFSKQIFPRMKVPITPYTYRQNFGRKIKTVLGDDDESIAIAMGHSNNKSQTYYSNASKKSGGFSIDQITGTRNVKKISKNFSENTINNVLV